MRSGREQCRLSTVEPSGSYLCICSLHVGMADVFPGLLDQWDFVDDSYNRGELERKEYPELQSIAAEHPSDEVHGRMSHEDLLDGLEGRERI